MATIDFDGPDHWSRNVVTFHLPGGDDLRCRLRSVSFAPPALVERLVALLTERVEALREPGLVGWSWGPIEESLTMPEPRLFRAKGKAEVGRGRSLGPNSSTYVGTPKVVLDYDTVSDYRGTAA